MLTTLAIVMAIGSVLWGLLAMVANGFDMDHDATPPMSYLPALIGIGIAGALGILIACTGW